MPVIYMESSGIASGQVMVTCGWEGSGVAGGRCVAVGSGVAVATGMGRRVGRGVGVGVAEQTRETARQQLQLAIAGLALHGQRISPQ